MFYRSTTPLCFLPVSAGLFAISALVSCTTGPSWYDQIRDPNSAYYTGTHGITVNRAALDSMTPSNSRLEIDLRQQKARLYKIDGNGDKRVSIETPVSTGKEGYRTPAGNFTITEKLPRKTSTLYGFWVDPRTEAVLDRDGDSRHPPGGRADLEFRGAEMPYWLRLTGSGIGIHEGTVPNRPDSHGCIRIPAWPQRLIYEKVAVGTPVTIRG